MMKKVLIVYFSHSGNTEKMAEYIAEGVRFTGNQAEVRQTTDIKAEPDFKGYDGYIFGSPTYSLDIPAIMKSFLSQIPESDLKSKLAGAFGSYRHEVGYAPGGLAASMFFEKMQNEFGMEPFDLGPLQLKEEFTETEEGLRACQAYGKAFGQKLG